MMTEMYLFIHLTKLQLTAQKKSFFGLVHEAKVGEVYHAKVVRIEKFGAFVNLFDKTDALVHISEISWSRTANVSDVLEVGEKSMLKLSKLMIKVVLMLQ